MFGQISTYVTSKGYGFIIGEDDKDYYFKFCNFKGNIEKIAEGISVSFSPNANHKGYFATDIHMVCSKDSINYALPENTIYTKSGSINGWEIIERTDWRIMGTSPDGPDDAKREMLYHARNVGATGLTEVSYSKSTGSRGNYRFTIHHYTGNAVKLAKKSTTGTHTRESLLGLEQAIEKEKSRLVRQKHTHYACFALLLAIVGCTWIALKTFFSTWIFYLLISLFAASIAYGIYIYRCARYLDRHIYQTPGKERRNSHRNV